MFTNDYYEHKKPGESMEDEQIPADGEQEVSADRDANQDDRILCI